MYGNIIHIPFVNDQSFVQQGLPKTLEKYCLSEHVEYRGMYLKIFLRAMEENSSLNARWIRCVSLS